MTDSKTSKEHTCFVCCNEPCTCGGKRSSKERLAPLVQRLNEACVAACDCLVKTPVIHYHQPTCKYRVMQEAASALGALDACYDAFMIGAKVRTPSTLLANIQNAFRRSNCLSAIEREFFTRKVEDDGSDEIIEDCPMNWGAEPAEYVEQFREALAARAAVEPADVRDLLRVAVEDYEMNIGRAKSPQHWTNKAKAALAGSAEPPAETHPMLTVLTICDAYESGMGQGLQKRTFDNPYDPVNDPHAYRAYGHGYDEGVKRASPTKNDPCKGKNCGSTDPRLHSADCFEEYDRTIAGTAHETGDSQ